MIAVDLRFYDGHYDGGVYRIVRSVILSFNDNNFFLTIANLQKCFHLQKLELKK